MTDNNIFLAISPAELINIATTTIDHVCKIARLSVSLFLVSYVNYL